MGNGERAKLRHEFVGMMFAVAVGEVGLQVAALVRAGHIIYFLPAYSHLFLGTIVIATSWIGWSVSVAPGNRQDVKGIFQWEFLVLLLDVALVIMYFILVRAVHFESLDIFPSIEPASTVAFWLMAVFSFYFLWDLVTKVAMYFRNGEDNWLLRYGPRITPTMICLIISVIVWIKVGKVDRAHLVCVDFALLCVVLLFRALKELASALHPPSATRTGGAKKVHLMLLCLCCILGVSYGTMSATQLIPLPVPCTIIQQMNAPKP